MDSIKRIELVCDSIKEMLLNKNRKYGNSALAPVRVFSRSDSVEQIKVRIDDKLSRYSNMQNDEDEDVIDDLIGYLILLKIAIALREEDEEKMISNAIKSSWDKGIAQAVGERFINSGVEKRMGIEGLYE